MASKLVDFLTSVGKDPDLRSAFKTDPHSVMSRAGLQPAEMAAVLSKNPAIIHKAVIDSLGQPSPAAETVVVVVL